jgi:hypothetical protein
MTEWRQDGLDEDPQRWPSDWRNIIHHLVAKEGDHPPIRSRGKTAMTVASPIMRFFEEE